MCCYEEEKSSWLLEGNLDLIFFFKDERYRAYFFVDGHDSIKREKRAEEREKCKTEVLENVREEGTQCTSRGSGLRYEQKQVR